NQALKGRHQLTARQVIMPPFQGFTVLASSASRGVAPGCLMPPLWGCKPMPLTLIVTSGGTEVPIDGVRCITNFSKRTTRALPSPAGPAPSAGPAARPLCPRSAPTPLGAGLGLPPHRAPDPELPRLKQAAERYRAVADRLEILRVPDFDSYREKLLELVRDPA